MATFHSVLVTGANRGIGLQFIVDLVDKTKHLIATARDVEKATELKKLAAKHPNLHVLQLEVTDYKRHDSLVDEIANIVGEKGLTLSIQNAGMNIPENFEESNPESYAKVLDVNAIAPLFLTRQLLPLLRKSAASGERTFAVFLGSCLGSVEMNSQFTLTDFNAYRMSKSALHQGVRTMANYYKDEQIEFVLFHPGHVQTGECQKCIASKRGVSIKKRLN